MQSGSWIRGAWRGILAGGMALALLGCSGGGSVHPKDRVATPPATLTAAEEMHLLSVTTPGPGWTLSFDRSVLARDDTRLLFTLRRPDPTVYLPNREVTLRAISDTPTTEPVTVLVRVLRHDASDESGRYARPTGLEG